MAGAKHIHNLIAVNVLGELRQALPAQPCFVWGSDMRGRTEDDVRTYPDISARCGAPHFSDDAENELTNPTVFMEVLSPSTEADDRGEKFAHYRTLRSLQMYVLVATNQRHVDVFTRQAGGAWLLQSYIEAGIERSRSLLTPTQQSTSEPPVPLPNATCTD